MSHRLTIAASLALPLLAGAAWAQQGDPPTVGISVGGTVVEVPVDLAAQACGISAATLLDQWRQLDTQIATMADTTVAADAADLAPVASPADSQKASGVGPSDPDGAKGTDAASPAEAAAGAGPGTAAGAAGSPAASGAGTPAGSGADAAGAGGDLSPVVAAASPAASAAENPQKALDAGAAPTEGTPLSRAAVCEIDAGRAAELGIQTPG